MMSVFLAIGIVIVGVLIFSLFVSHINRTPYMRDRIDYSKDYMNNPIVRNMNERDRNL